MKNNENAKFKWILLVCEKNKGKEKSGSVLGKAKETFVTLLFVVAVKIQALRGKYPAGVGIYCLQFLNDALVFFYRLFFIVFDFQKQPLKRVYCKSVGCKQSKPWRYYSKGYESC